MEVQRGQVVRSLAGHDKGGFLAVVQVAPPFAFVCDGKTPPPWSGPSGKNCSTWPPRPRCCQREALRTNRQIRSALRRFAGSAENA